MFIRLQPLSLITYVVSPQNQIQLNHHINQLKPMFVLRKFSALRILKENAPQLLFAAVM